MSIGTTIKRLRREKDITQEQLAEYLGITSRAVSQWETVKTSPDISMIAPLTSIFNITSDQLLGIDIESKEQEIEKLYMDAYNTASVGDHVLAIKMTCEALMKHPSSYKLMDFYANEIFLYNDLTPVEEQRNNENRALGYLDKIMFECTDHEIYNNSTTMACLWYARLGEVDKAESIAKNYSGAMWTHGELLGKIYTGKRQFEILREEMLRQFTTSLGDILNNLQNSKDDDGYNIYSDDEKLMLNRMCIEMFALYFPYGDYLYNAKYVARAYREMSDIYASRKDTERTIECLNSVVDFTIQFDSVKPDDTHSSPSVKGITAGNLWLNEGHNTCMRLLEKLKESKYDFIRNTTEFSEIIGKLNMYAK